MIGIGREAETNVSLSDLFDQVAVAEHTESPATQELELGLGIFAEVGVEETETGQNALRRGLVGLGAASVMLPPLLGGAPAYAGSAEAQFFLQAETHATATANATVVSDARRKPSNKKTKKRNSSPGKCTDDIPKVAGDWFCIKPGHAMVTQEYSVENGEIIWGTRVATWKDVVWKFNSKTGYYENYTIKYDENHRPYVCKNILKNSPKHEDEGKRKKPHHRAIHGGIVEVNDQVDVSANTHLWGLAEADCGNGYKAVTKIDIVVAGSARATVLGFGKFALNADSVTTLQSDAKTAVENQVNASGAAKCETPGQPPDNPEKPDLGAYTNINHLYPGDPVDITVSVYVPAGQTVTLLANGTLISFTESSKTVVGDPDVGKTFDVVFHAVAVDELGIGGSYTIGIAGTEKKVSDTFPVVARPITASSVGPVISTFTDTHVYKAEDVEDNIGSTVDLAS